MPSSPDDLALWQRLAEPGQAALIAAARDIEPGDVRGVERLRRAHAPELVPVALDLAAATRKARVKLPTLAERLIADVAGVEMASSENAAGWKARRFTRVRLFDLCCGIGGDAFEPVRGGADVVAVDIDPVRAWMAGRNAGCEAKVSDVTGIDTTGATVHIDPARREAAGSGRRRIRLEEMRPPIDVVNGLIARADGAAVKLAPGVNPDQLPTGELEYISEHGRMTQAVLWTGGLRELDGVRATMLPEGETFVGGAESAGVVDQIVDGVIGTVDPAIERAGLIGHLAAMLGGSVLGDPGSGLVTGCAPARWVRRYGVLARMPWRERRVKPELESHGAGLVRVKTRGNAVDPDVVQKRLRGSGDRELAVFIQRIGGGVEAVIAEPLGV